MSCAITPITNFGIHQATFKDLVNKDVWGTAFILDGAEPDFNQDLIDLRGGSSAFPWSSAPGEATGEIPITIKQYDKNVLRFLNPYIDGSQIENDTGESLGDVSAIENIEGTSVVDATTGIASIAADAGNESLLTYGSYIAVAVSSTTIDIYLDTNIDGKISYVDDTLKVTDTPITIPGTGGTATWNGVEFTGGSGAISMTIGDIAKFGVRPINSYLLQNYIHKDGSSPREFELTIAGEKIGDRIRVARYRKCIAGGGGNLKFLYKDWSTIETTIKVLKPCEYDHVALEDYINR
jgi:hypothetical protein